MSLAPVTSGCHPSSQLVTPTSPSQWHPTPSPRWHQVPSLWPWQWDQGWQTLWGMCEAVQQCVLLSALGAQRLHKQPTAMQPSHRSSGKELASMTSIRAQLLLLLWKTACPLPPPSHHRIHQAPTQRGVRIPFDSGSHADGTLDPPVTAPASIDQQVRGPMIMPWPT